MAATITATQADRPQLLRGVLRFNAGLSLLLATALFIGAGPFASWTGLTPLLVYGVAAALLPFAWLCWAAAARWPQPRWLALLALDLDIAWVALSSALLIGGWLPLTSAGWWVVLVQALLIADIAIVTIIALLRAWPRSR